MTLISIFLSAPAHAIIATPGIDLIDQVLNETWEYFSMGMPLSPVEFREKVYDRLEDKLEKYASGMGKAVAHIRIVGDSSTRIGSGVLIHRNESDRTAFVLTAGHLFDQSLLAKGELKIFLTFTNEPGRNLPSHWISARTAHVHPGYRPVEFVKDSGKDSGQKSVQGSGSEIEKDSSEDSREYSEQDLALVEFIMPPEFNIQPMLFGFSPKDLMESANEPFQIKGFFLAGFGSHTFSIDPALVNWAKGLSSQDPRRMRFGLDVLRRLHDVKFINAVIKLPNDSRSRFQVSKKWMTHTGGVFKPSDKNPQVGKIVFEGEIKTLDYLFRSARSHYDFFVEDPSQLPTSLIYDFFGIPTMGDSGCPLFRYDAEENRFRVFGIHSSEETDIKVGEKLGKIKSTSVAITPEYSRWIRGIINSR